MAYVRGACTSLWKGYAKRQRTYTVLRKNLRRFPEAKELVFKLMQAYELNVDEALGVLMALYCLLEDNMLYYEQQK